MNKYSNLEIIQNMTLMDDIFMSVFFDNEPSCVEDILDAVLPFKATVESVTTQYRYNNVYGHSVTFDIWARDSENKIYDIEIQKSSKGATPQRARFHSSLLDTEALEKNSDYDTINETYVIFITETDVLGENKPLYRIERTIQGSGRTFNDGSHIIYINTSYVGEGTSKI